MKLYVEEEGFEKVRVLDGVAISILARVEVPSAFWRKRRTGSIDSGVAATLTRAFEADLAGDAIEQRRFVVLPVGARLLDRAARHVARYGLRGFDAVQLASAVMAREVDESCTTFACFDRQLCDAAGAEGFDVLG